MLKNNSTDRMNEVYEQFKEFFISNIHTALWHLYVDDITAGKLTCFAANYTNAGQQLGIAVANEWGYIPTPAYFKDGITYDRAQEILASMNKEVFDLDEKTCDDIVLSSMRKRRSPEVETGLSAEENLPIQQ
jgi:hypothetical protein